jgi:hypothetical protein
MMIHSTTSGSTLGRLVDTFLNPMSSLRTTSMNIHTFWMVPRFPQGLLRMWKIPVQQLQLPLQTVVKSFFYLDIRLPSKWTDYRRRTISTRNSGTVTWLPLRPRSRTPSSLLHIVISFNYVSGLLQRWSIHSAMIEFQSSLSARMQRLTWWNTETHWRV